MLAKAFVESVQVRAEATAVAGRAIDALTGGACAGSQTELVQRLAFQLLGRRCAASPAFHVHLLRWIYQCAAWASHPASNPMITAVPCQRDSL